MISNHPYNTWPLHVKLFTDEAVKGWQDAMDVAMLPLPLGFTCNVELEGVDGKSGYAGSGRQGSIRVKDGNVLHFNARLAPPLQCNQNNLCRYI
jgi:structure-specific endonuclease subunit SLX1